MTKREAKRHALGFAESAIDGALNHSASGHDPVMMRWAKGNHEKVDGRSRRHPRRSQNTAQGPVMSITPDDLTKLPHRGGRLVRDASWRDGGVDGSA